MISMILIKLYKRFHSLLRTVGIYTIANFIERATAFFLLPILTRLLTQADYGILGTFNAIKSNVEPVVSMAIPGAVCRAYYDRKRAGFNFSEYLFNAMLINLGLFGLITLIWLILSTYLSQRFHFPLLWLWIIPFITLVSSLSSIKSKLWIFQKQATTIAYYNILKTITNLSLSLFLIFWVLKDWRGRIIGICFAELLFCTIALYLLWKQDGIRFKLNQTYLKDALKYGLPLYPHSLGWIMITTADKFFINYLLGLSVLGVYNVGLGIGSIIVMLSVPVEMAVSPYIYEILERKDYWDKKKYVLFLYGYNIVLIVLAVILSLTCPYILKFFVGARFQEAGAYIWWASFANVAFAMYRFVSLPIYYAKKTYLLAWITFFSGVVSIGANYVLIPKNGAIGGIQATLIAYTTSVVLTWFLAQKLYPMPLLTFFSKHKGSQTINDET